MRNSHSTCHTAPALPARSFSQWTPHPDRLPRCGPGPQVSLPPPWVLPASRRFSQDCVRDSRPTVCSIDLLPFGETGFRAHSRFIVTEKLEPFLANVSLVCTVGHASAHITVDAHVILAKLYFPLKLGMAQQVDPHTISHCLSVGLRLCDNVNSSVKIY